jgi:hypothetical protein
MLLGLSLVAIYHVAAAGLTLRPRPSGPEPASEVVSLSAQRIGLPAIAIITVVLTFIWYFTLGNATVRDLRRIFEPDADAEEIEPWMVEQVRRRVAHTSTASAIRPEDWDREEPLVPVHAVAIVGRDVAHAIAHRARAALPSANQPTVDPDRTDSPDEVDVHRRPVDAWPGGRNELAAARVAAPWSSNSRFGSVLAGETDGRDPFGDVSPDTWAERLAAARADVAAGHPGAPTIVREQSGSSLPRRNTPPLHRP